MFKKYIVFGRAYYGKANTCYFRDYSLVYHGFEDPRMAN